MSTLLKISKIHENLSIEFNRIANDLMNNHVCLAGTHEIRFAEIECYGFNKEYHNDISVHCDPIQAEFGKWYFHRSQPSLKFKPHNRIGLDLTFGNTEEGFSGGILIRAIQLLPSEEYIYGPSKVVEKICELAKIDDYAELQETSVFNNSRLSVIPAELKSETVFSGPRVGLKNPQNKYNDTFYRFYIFPLLKHADKEKTLIPALLKQGVPPEQILKIFNRKSLSFLNY
jgi:3-methyladenine DNA glycosylase Mpg